MLALLALLASLRSKWGSTESHPTKIVFSSPWEKLLDVPAPATTGVITITNLPGSDPVRFYRVVTRSQP